MHVTIAVVPQPKTKNIVHICFVSQSFLSQKFLEGAFITTFLLASSSALLIDVTFVIEKFFQGKTNTGLEHNNRRNIVAASFARQVKERIFVFHFDILFVYFYAASSEAGNLKHSFRETVRAKYNFRACFQLSPRPLAKYFKFGTRGAIYCWPNSTMSLNWHL